ANAVSARAGVPRVVLAGVETPVHVRADSAAMERVVVNLLDNALKFAPTGCVTVSVGSTGDGAVLLRVADEGPGVADDEKERIFERFHQTEAGRAAPQR